MAIIHIDPRQTQVDLCRFVAQGILRRSRFGEASDSLKQQIQETIGRKAQGVFLRAHLMLDILKWQTAEDDIQQCLHVALSGIDDMVTEMLKVYSSVLKEKEHEELKTILAWLLCATRPSRYVELEAALQRLSPTGSKAISLENRIQGTYASLLEIRHDNVVSMTPRSYDNQPVSGDDSTKSESTLVVFVPAAIDEFFQKELGKFSWRSTMAPLGGVRAEAELEILRTCLAVLVESGQANCLAASQALQPYAKESWALHLSSCINGRVIDAHRGEAAELHLDITNLLYRFLNEEEVLELWCRDTTW
jgi:hypothetical protein